MRALMASLVEARWSSACLLGAVAAALALVHAPIELPCPFEWTFGLDCPLCGGTRMLRALLNGDILGALDRNAFALVLVLPLSGALLIAGVRKELGYTNRIWPRGRLGTKCAIVLCAAVLGWTVLRNLPFGALPALAA